MGGYSYSKPEPPREPTLAENLEKNIKGIFSSDESKRANLLVEAFQYAKQNNISFLKHLLDGRGDLENSLAGIEIEAKINYAVGLRESDVEDKLRGYSVSDNTRFLKCRDLAKNAGYHHYFGTDEKEGFTVMMSEAGTHIKIKGSTGSYAFGIKGEEYILRRTEELKKVLSPRENEDVFGFIQLIVQSCSPTPMHYVGSFEKTKATQWVIEREHGRIYSLVLGLCKKLAFKGDNFVKENGSQLVQVEIEYAGCIPGFSSHPKKESEKIIVEDIVTISGYIANKYKLQPTLQTKFDWLTGNKPKEVKKKDIPKEMAGQALFDEAI